MKIRIPQQPTENWYIFQRTVRNKRQTLTTDNLPPPLFQIQTVTDHTKPEPLYGFKYSPWPPVLTLAMFEPFFKYNPFPMTLFVAFCAKADPTPDSAPVANVGRTVFAKNGRAFAANPARNPRNPHSIFILWTTWRLLIFIVIPFPSW